MFLRHPLAWVIGLTAFVVNPAMGCGANDTDDFEYGEAEMVAAVQGRWQLTFSRPEGTSSMTFTLEPGADPNPPADGGLASPPGRTPQCTTRTFTRPAAACSPTSRLRLTARIVEAEPPLETSEGQGWFTAFGETYRGGAADVTFGAELVLFVSLDANNAIRDSYVDWRKARVTSVLTRLADK
jgi:hypothetical protein